MNKFKTNKLLLTISILTIISFSIGILLVKSNISLAGSLNNTDSPAPTFYTLLNIYNRLATNATAVAEDHNLGPSANPASTSHTLTEIYNLIPTITPANVFNGTEYLGVTGTLNLACSTTTFDGVSNLVGDTYDGTGTGLNRWCVTDTGDAGVANILQGKKAWVDGIEVTGTMTDREGDNASTAQTALAGINYLTVATGFYDGDDRVSTTDAELVVLDSDLVVTNIKSGIAIFGVTGTLLPNTGTATVADLFNSKTAHLTSDWNLDTGTLNLACNTTTFDGVSNLVGDAYDGTGTGLDRWCITNTGDALAGDILSGKKAWIDGIEVTGTMSAADTSVSTLCLDTPTYYNAMPSCDENDPCDSSFNGTYTADGIVVNEGTCETGDVCFDTPNYYSNMSSCDNNDPCDSDVAPTYTANGLICSAVCVVDGSVANDGACCNDLNCTSGDCTGEVCVAGFDPDGSVTGLAGYGTPTIAYANPYNNVDAEGYNICYFTVDAYPGAVAYYLYQKRAQLSLMLRGEYE